MLKRNQQVIRTLVAAVAATLVPTTYVNAGTTTDASTISLSGSTAMRAFTTNSQFTALRPGNTVNLSTGRSFTADPGSSTVFPAIQLGATTNDAYPQSDTVNANYRAFRVEWHEQGSVEGILELANDQIGYTSGNQIVTTNRNPTPGNPSWINGLVATPTGGLTGYVGQAGSGLVTNSALGGFNQSSFDTYTNFSLAGVNNAGGQNRVQMAISDVTARQGFSSGGTGAYNRTPGQAGYGKGNPALAGAANTSGVGFSNARQQLVDASVLNMSTDKVDPSTGTTYAGGTGAAWNTAGVDNLNNKKVAITATTFAANPGTGLTQINRTDAQFLQATGRLANGADFNVVTRDVNSGTRNVAALNVGLDPSFAVGENDDGNTGTGTAAESTAQASIGGSIKFSGKTAGGNALRPTIQNSRMAVGHLSISDIRSGNAAGTATNANVGNRPLRALSYRDDANDVADGSNAGIASGFADAASGTFVKPSFDTITDGTYAIYQNETYITVKTPDANYAADTIKGDYDTNDVKQFRENILSSAASYKADNSTGTGFLNPANALISTGFIPTQYMKVKKDQDGLNQSVPNAYDTANFASVRANALSSFVVADAAAVTTGTSSTYGNIALASGGVPITATNYLFGNFDTDTDRDFADVKLAVAYQSSLFVSGAGVQLGTNNTAGDPSLNSQVIAGAGGFTKGDLIVKGDFNSDGRFDGKDLYLLAHGAALADSTTTDTLTTASGATFGDQVRNGVLRKNAALDYLDANATAQQRTDAGGANAFNKFDVNHDGVLDRKDASIVDKFVGNNITDLGQQIAATIAADGSVSGTLAQRAFSLVDAELQDNLSINATIGGTAASPIASDFSLIRDALQSLLALKPADSNFDGSVNFDDLLTLAQNYNTSVDRWSKGDFNLDGGVSFDDLLILAQNYQGSGLTVDGAPSSFAADWALARSLVPEPGSLAAVGLVLSAISRRTRKMK